MNTNNTASWWYASNNQKRGPFTEAGLRDLAQSGQIAAHDWVWQRGMDDWVLASSIEGLIPQSVAAPAPSYTVDAAENKLQEDGGFSIPVQRALQGLEAATDASSAQQVDAFIGTNQVFYARQWQFAERNSLSFSWNWAAFFFGVLWMAYRKMYLPCAIFVVTTLGIMSGAIALQLPLGTLQAVLQTVQICFVVLFGLYGNLVYRWHVQRTLRRIGTQYPPEQAQQQMARWGGVSLLSVLAVTMLILLATMMMGSMLSMFVDAPVQPDQTVQPIK